MLKFLIMRLKKKYYNRDVLDALENDHWFSD